VLAEKHRPEVGMRQTRPSPETQNPPPCETQTPQKLKKTAEEPHKLTKGQLKRHVFSPQDQGRGGLRVEAVAEGVACEVDHRVHVPLCLTTPERWKGLPNVDLSLGAAVVQSGDRV